MRMLSLLCLGDSLTARGWSEEQGWTGKLARAYSGRGEVNCRGQSGYNSRWAAHELERALGTVEKDCVEYVTIWLGANDSVLSVTGARQFVPLDEFQSNLETMVNKLLQQCPNVKRIALMSCPPIVEKQRLIHQKNKYGEKATGDLERTLANTRLYARTCMSTCQNLERVGHIDVFSAFMARDDMDELFCDGLHLSAKGNEAIFDLVVKDIETHVPELAPERRPGLLPAHMKCELYPGKKWTTSGPIQVFHNMSIWDWTHCSFRNNVQVAVQGGKVLQVAKANKQLECTVDTTESVERVDMQGKFVLPGLADAHIHVYHMGENQACLNLLGCKSLAEMQKKLGEFCEAHPEREWIMGVGWDHELMGGTLPSRFDLDAVTPPGKKVFMWRVCFHIAVANTAAMEACEVPLRNPPPVEGGEIAVTSDGTATGIFKESAVGLILGKIDEPSDQVKEKYILDGLRECLEGGLTSVQTNDGGTFEIYKRLDQDGKLPIRVYLTAVGDDVTEPYYSPSGMLVCERVKIFTDGALGANTAAIREGEGKHRGILIHSQDELDGLVSKAKSRNLRVEAHAIGDAAAEAVLKAFSRAGLSRKDRPIVTHCQILGEDLISQMAEMGAIANVQPTFVPTDSAWVKERLSKDKLTYSYCWLTLIQNGIQVAGSSDCPVETCRPLQGMFDAVYRPTSHVTTPPTCDDEVFLPSERLSLSQALQLYTLGANYAARFEHVRGRIEPGFDADWTVIDSDIAARPDLLAQAKIEAVYVGGERKFSRGESVIDEDGQLRNNGAYARGKGGDPLMFCRCPHNKRWACC